MEILSQLNDGVTELKIKHKEEKEMLWRRIEQLLKLSKALLKMVYACTYVYELAIVIAR